MILLVEAEWLSVCMYTPVQFFQHDKSKDFMDIWNVSEYQKYRAIVNTPQEMDKPCRRCYQSSHCNCNRKESFIQVGEQFSPDWE
ncbi:MAG: SPASM domain-containing protein [Butyrivibrio sp.]|nr:SPASM domain-containing protein [Butyrivibrio sp.]